MATTLYPPKPIDTPKNLTSLTSSYQLRAFLAILAIILFFILYFALVTALGYLIYLAVIYPIENVTKWTILLKVGAVAGSVMLFVFTLKFIFKLKNFKPENRIKLNKKEHPELLDFVNQICEDTGAPKPKSIYVDPDVNAYVSYTNMWLSLFLPVRKDLTIGLGLVSCLNLSEFKAVIAHEFGHFAQKSMKIGSYINSANTIIHDMIFNRDKWDEALEKWRDTDIRLSFAAWGITPIIWLIRQLLRLFYIFLNIMHSSLSREMEFNADKVAVRAAGSDSIISALWKLEDGAALWNGTINNSYLASQKNQFVQNLYVHNNLAIDRNQDNQERKLSSLPEDSRGGKKYFINSANSKVNMYASHPPNDMRQDNAKTPYVPCEMDERSPWLLFSNTNALQEEMTKKIYKIYLNKKPESFVDEQQFEKFIEAESLGKELLAEYGNTFEQRFLHIPTEVEFQSYKPSNESFKEQIKKLKAELVETSKPVDELNSLIQFIQQIAQGTTTQKSFSYNGNTYTKKTLQEGYNMVASKRDELLITHFKSWDISFCSLYLAIAKKLNRENDLLNLYKQHNGLNNVYRELVNIQNFIVEEINRLQSISKEITHSELGSFGRKIKDRVDGVNPVIEEMGKSKFVPLPNIDNFQEFKEAIVAGGEFKREPGNIFENGGLDRIMNQISQAIGHCQRLDQKSIGSILALHHEFEEQL